MKFGTGVQGGVVRERDLADVALLQGRGRIVGQGAQARPALGVPVGGESGVAAADEDELVGVGFEGRAGGEAVVRAESGQGGDRGGDLRGGGGRQGLVRARAVEPLAGGDVDDRGGAPGAERRVAQERAEELGEGRAGRGRLDAVARSAEAGEDGGGAGRGLRSGAGRAGGPVVICATPLLLGSRPVPLRRTLTGGVPRACGGHHSGGQCQSGRGGARGVLPGLRPSDPRDLRLRGPRDPCDLRFHGRYGSCETRSHGTRGSNETWSYGVLGPCQTRSYGVRDPRHLRSRGSPRPQLWHDHQPLSRSHTCVRDT